jgi:hypothetical protein
MASWTRGRQQVSCQQDRPNRSVTYQLTCASCNKNCTTGTVLRRHAKCSRDSPFRFRPSNQDMVEDEVDESDTRVTAVGCSFKIARNCTKSLFRIAVTEAIVYRSNSSSVTGQIWTCLRRIGGRCGGVCCGGGIVVVEVCSSIRGRFLEYLLVDGRTANS